MIVSEQADCFPSFPFPGNQKIKQMTYKSNNNNSVEGGKRANSITHIVKKKSIYVC